MFILGFVLLDFVWALGFGSMAPLVPCLAGKVSDFDSFLLVSNQVGCNRKFGDEHRILISIGMWFGK